MLAHQAQLYGDPEYTTIGYFLKDSDGKIEERTRTSAALPPLSMSLWVAVKTAIRRGSRRA
jgi:hypothetical protein